MIQINLDFIKKRRLELGYTNQIMAEKLGFKNASNYYKYETGEYSFKASMLPVLSKILNCDMKNFFIN
jgi:transcriptional regulator with XRE-family HTH domain